MNSKFANLQNKKKIEIRFIIIRNKLKVHFLLSKFIHVFIIKSKKKIQRNFLKENGMQLSYRKCLHVLIVYAYKIFQEIETQP